jgi:hypothetical protein
MTRTRHLFTLFLTSVFLLNACSVHADCVCLKGKMFPYASGYWMYYAERTDDACVHKSSVSVIAQMTATCPATCSTTVHCGSCQPLGGGFSKASDVINCHLHTDATLPAYTDVNTPDKIKKFLKANIFFLTDLGELANARTQIQNMTFQSPTGPAASPPVVLLRRETAAPDKDFYVVLWKMQTPGNPEWAYMGVEISDMSVPSGATNWTSNVRGDIHRAKASATDDRLEQSLHIKGLIEVVIGPDVDPKKDPTYFIRLGYTDKNRKGNAFKLRN